jgi:hypothetical protein
MRFFLSLLLVLAFSGCERSSEDHGITDDVRAKNALKAALVEARLAAYDKGPELTSVSDLISALEQQGHMSALSEYGRTNIFFNPQVSIWKESSLGNRPEAAEHAIVIRRRPDDYVGVTFDGRFVKEQRCPAKWCE